MAAREVVGNQAFAADLLFPGWRGHRSARSFAVFYLPPYGGIWVLRPPGLTGYTESPGDALGDDAAIALRNDSFRKAVEHAERFIHGR